MTPPNLVTTGKPSAQCSGVTLAVYAPFGTDPVLSTYPGGARVSITEHPLVVNLAAVAKCGVNVVALVDLHGDDTWLVEIPAHKPEGLRATSRWKQQMQAINTLSGFLRHAQRLQPGSALVLALEGHGAGYLPELDLSQLSTANLTEEGSFEWRLDEGSAAPMLPMGSPLLPMGSPLLPMGSPLLPLNHWPLSTWGLGQALKDALAEQRKLGVIHFNNCFNMAVELLHTVAPHAEYATGYMNYNFFTAGEPYPLAFGKLAAAGSGTTEQLARWLAEANRDVLDSMTHHPTVGATVELARLPRIAAGIDALAKALIVALTSATPQQRPIVVTSIRSAILAAQQYDTAGSPRLDPPDELTDVASLATQFLAFDVNAEQVRGAAADLQAELKGIKVYGANTSPWTAPNIVWDFSRDDLAMNILCPDPALRGLWDWRSPYYLQLEPPPNRPAVQPHVIDFLKHTAWVPFIVEYHREVPFVGLRPAAIPEYPVFNRKHCLPGR